MANLAKSSISSKSGSPKKRCSSLTVSRQWLFQWRSTKRLIMSLYLPRKEQKTKRKLDSSSFTTWGSLHPGRTKISLTSESRMANLGERIGSTQLPIWTPQKNLRMNSWISKARSLLTKSSEKHRTISTRPRLITHGSPAITACPTLTIKCWPREKRIKVCSRRSTGTVRPHTGTYSSNIIRLEVLDNRSKPSSRSRRWPSAQQTSTQNTRTPSCKSRYNNNRTNSSLRVMS